MKPERRSGPFKTTRLMVKLHLVDKAFLDQKCTKCRLAAWLRPDPLGELTALLRPASCIETPRTLRVGYIGLHGFEPRNNAAVLAVVTGLPALQFFVRRVVPS